MLTRNDRYISPLRGEPDYLPQTYTLEVVEEGNPRNKEITFFPEDSAYEAFNMEVEAIEAQKKESANWIPVIVRLIDGFDLPVMRKVI